MASIKDIRRRISSVKNTQQITRAMKMVAASKLRRAQDAIAGARPFAEKIEKITQRVLLGVKKDDLFKVSPLLAAHTKKDNDQKLVVALLIITGDRGLCGAYNSTIIKHANRRIQELQKDPKVEVKAFFVGRRGYEAFKRKKLEGHYFDTFWAGKLSSSKASKLADDFAVRFSAG